MLLVLWTLIRENGMADHKITKEKMQLTKNKFNSSNNKESAFCETENSCELWKLEIVSYKLTYGTGTYFQALDYMHESNVGTVWKNLSDSKPNTKWALLCLFSTDAVVRKGLNYFCTEVRHFTKETNLTREDNLQIEFKYFSTMVVAFQNLFAHLSVLIIINSTASNINMWVFHTCMWYM